jgi:hypothetical protein
MEHHYPDAWDKRVLAFLRRFEGEGHFLKVPKEIETLHNFPTPRSWSDLALYLHAGLKNDDLICGLVGEETGQKFQAFLKVNVDLNELISNPELFRTLNLDARYMSCVMLGTYLTKNYKKAKKTFPLLDVMASISRDLLVLTLISVKHKQLVEVLRQLKSYNKEYMSVLKDIAVKLKRELKA